MNFLKRSQQVVKHGYMGMTSKPRFNRHNESCLKSQVRKAHKFDQIWRFHCLFFNLNDLVHHKFFPYNLTVNKQYLLEGMCRFCETILLTQICGRTMRGNCIIIICFRWHLTDCSWFFSKKQNRSLAWASVFAGHGPLWLLCIITIYEIENR